MEAHTRSVDLGEAPPEGRTAQSLAQAAVQLEARMCFAVDPAGAPTEAHIRSAVVPGEVQQEVQTAQTLAQAAVQKEARIRSAADLKKKTQTAQRSPAAAPALPCRHGPQSCL